MFGKLISDLITLILILIVGIIEELMINTDERLENNEKARVEVNVFLIVVYVILSKYRKRRELKTVFSIDSNKFQLN